MSDIIEQLVYELTQKLNQMEMAGDCIEAGRYDEALLHTRAMMRSAKLVLWKADLVKYIAVPAEPSNEMINAACQDGIVVEGRPVWKHDVVFQARWRYKQMLKARPKFD